MKAGKTTNASGRKLIGGQAPALRSFTELANAIPARPGPSVPRLSKAEAAARYAQTRMATIRPWTDLTNAEKRKWRNPEYKG